MKTNKLSKQILNLWRPVESLNILAKNYFFDLTIVGGLVRDMLLGVDLENIISKGEISSLDFDLELNFLGRDDDYNHCLQKFKTKIKKYIIKDLSYGVFQVKYQNIIFDIAPARIEKFNLNSFHHKNFDIQFLSKIDYRKSFKRRDFSINAIGINHELKIIDPFRAMLDIQKHRLIACNNETFCLDPVRFLRTLRFAIKYKFKFTQVEKLFCKFNLKSLSYFYFFSEAYKSNNVLLFFSYFFHYTQKYQINIPDFVLKIEAPLKKMLLYIEQYHIKNKKEFVQFIVNIMRFGDDELYLFASYLEIKKSKIKKIKVSRK